MIHEQLRLATHAAESVGKTLIAKGLKIVLAESCTVGMVAALLGTVPGISAVLCGSMVTYRERTKTGWLDIDSDLILSETAESIPVTVEMASQVLRKTPEAYLAAAVTGNLGPGVSNERDGIIFVSITSQDSTVSPLISEHKLVSSDRDSRQLEAAKSVFEQIRLFVQT